MDIANEYYGSIEGVWWIVEDNNLPSFLVSPYGININVRDDYKNKKTRDLLFNVATGDEERPNGIGFMKIETDFIIS